VVPICSDGSHQEGDGGEILCRGDGERFLVHREKNGELQGMCCTIIFFAKGYGSW
jgi:hypothetical protein